MGNLYDSGQGLAKDYAAAVQWYRKAAEQKMPQAEYALGACYADGEGVTKDLVEAYKWLSLAAAHGNTNAAPYKTTLEQKLTPDQRSKAREIAEAALRQTK